MEVECYHQFPCQWTFVHWSDWNFKRNLSAKNVLPRKLTWTVKMMVCNGNPLFQGFIFICEMFVWEFRHVTVEVPLANSTNGTWSFHLANQKIQYFTRWIQWFHMIPYAYYTPYWILQNAKYVSQVYHQLSSNSIYTHTHKHLQIPPAQKRPWCSWGLYSAFSIQILSPELHQPHWNFGCLHSMKLT